MQNYWNGPYHQGWSQRRIAQALGIARETVARYLNQPQHASNQAKASTGLEAPAEPPKPAMAPTGSSPEETPQAGSQNTTTEPTRPGRSSDCEPYRSVILDKLALGLTAQRIWQDLVADHDFPSSYYSVRRFVQKLHDTQELPFRRLECEPGEEAQVDFGTGAPLVTPDGKKQRTHVFRLVLSYSRKGYAEVVERQTTDHFLRCLENAFWQLGGVPQCLVIDNLKAAVNHADWYDPEIHPKVRSFAQHYGVAILPTRPRTPRHKGKVEKGVDYVQSNALAGRQFASVAEQNEPLRHWEEHIADTRMHGTTRQQVGRVFAEVKRAALQPLPAERFPLFHEAQRKVQRDGYVAVQCAYYSVPPEYLGQQAWVRWDGRLVRLFNADFRSDNLTNNFR